MNGKLHSHSQNVKIHSIRVLIPLCAYTFCNTTMNEPVNSLGEDISSIEHYDYFYVICLYNSQLLIDSQFSKYFCQDTFPISSPTCNPPTSNPSICNLSPNLSIFSKDDSANAGKEMLCKPCLNASEMSHDNVANLVFSLVALEPRLHLFFSHPHLSHHHSPEDADKRDRQSVSR